jgi:hypothetical protein
MTRAGLGERPFEQCPVMAGLVAKVDDRAAVASQLTQTRHAALMDSALFAANGLRRFCTGA